MKIVAETKPFKDMLSSVGSLLSGLANDEMGDDILLSVENGKVTMEAGGGGVYARVSLPKASVGDGTEDGFVTISKSVLRGLRLSGDVTTLESTSKGGRLLYKGDKMSGYVECLDDDVGIRNQRPGKKDLPEFMEIEVNELMETAGSVCITPALNQANVDIHIKIRKGQCKAIASDLTRGAVAVVNTEAKGKLAFSLPTGRIAAILGYFSGSGKIEIGAKDGVLHVRNKRGWVVYPTSQVEDADDVEGVIKETRANPYDTAFSAKIGEAKEAAGSVASIVSGGVVADTKLEILLGATESKVTIRSSVGKMTHTFNVKRLSKSGKKQEVLLSSKFFAEFLNLIGADDERFRCDIWNSGVCIIEKMDMQEGERISYVMPLLEG